jgi:hypothetical protein
MDESHRHLLITAGEWQGLHGRPAAGPRQVRVPEAEQVEVKALVQSTRSAIVIG